MDKVKEILGGFCRVVDSREVQLNYLGLRNYMLQIYRDERWSGGYWNHFRGIPAKLDPCYGEAGTLVIEMESECPESVLQAKEAVRDYCKMEKSSIHTSDTEDEISLMKALLYNENSCWLMNHCRPDRYFRFTAKLNRLERLCREDGVFKESFVIVSEAVLSLYNVKPSGKMSFFSKNHIPPRLERFNDQEFGELPGRLLEDIFRPENMVYFCGFRFVTLELFNKIRGDKAAVRWYS